jgi:CO/xanthine dehydrogenase Mo-binding subunit
LRNARNSARFNDEPKTRARTWPELVSAPVLLAWHFARRRAAYFPPDGFPLDILEPGLEETAFFDPVNFTFPGGCHVAEVEIDL